MKLEQAFAAIALTVAGIAAAQDYPTRPIRVIVPYAPGGGSDAVARIVGQKLAEGLGQSVVVDNRAGASAMIGAEIVARATPDGYTLLMANPGANAINFALRAKTPYTEADLEPVILLGWSPIMAVTSASAPMNNVKDLIALAKAKPGQLSAGSSGTGGSSHLALELFKLQTGTDILHVPYKGAAPAFTDVMAGQLQLFFSTPVSVQPLVAGGRLKVLGVAGKQRLAIFPDVPTTAEQGLPGFDVLIWFGVSVPARTPMPIINKLNADMNAVLKLPEIRERFAQLGLEAQGGTPARFGAFLKEELARWAQVVKAANVRPE